MEVLVTKWFEVFLCDERTGKVLDSGLISKDAQVVAERLVLVQRGTLLNEERELVASVNGKVAVASTDSWSCSARRTSCPRDTATAQSSYMRS